MWSDVQREQGYDLQAQEMRGWKVGGTASCLTWNWGVRGRMVCRRKNEGDLDVKRGEVVTFNNTAQK